MKLPKGFRKHSGGPCPVKPDQYVETLILTAEGLGSGGVTRADMHDWTIEAHRPQDGLGTVVGYRKIKRGDRPKLDRAWRSSPISE